jgi:hypothetical protein
MPAQSVQPQSVRRLEISQVKLILRTVIEELVVTQIATRGRESPEHSSDG